MKARTTFKESKRLVELGMPINVADRCWYDTDGGLCYPRLIFDVQHGWVPAWYRQQIEDYLMERYCVTLRVIRLAGSYEFRSLVHLSNPDDEFDEDEPDRFENEGRDSFPALYDALVGHLERQRPPSTPTPEA